MKNSNQPKTSSKLKINKKEFLDYIEKFLDLGTFDLEADNYINSKFKLNSVIRLNFFLRLTKVVIIAIILISLFGIINLTNGLIISIYLIAFHILFNISIYIIEKLNKLFKYLGRAGRAGDKNNQIDKAISQIDKSLKQKSLEDEFKEVVNEKSRKNKKLL